MVGSGSPGDNASPETRRGWGSANVIRILALLAFVVVMGWRTFGSFGGAGLVWSVVIAVVVIVVSLVAIRVAARRRLATRAPGVRWVGTVSIAVPDFRNAPKLAASAPRPGFLSAFLLNHNIAIGRLAIEADGLSWTPGVFARWAGAKSWRIPRVDIARVETGSIPGLPRPIARGMQLWLTDGSTVAMQAATADQLAEALDELGMRRRRS